MVTEMENAFDGLISILDVAEKKISVSLEIGAPKDPQPLLHSLSCFLYRKWSQVEETIGSICWVVLGT